MIPNKLNAIKANVYNFQSISSRVLIPENLYIADSILPKTGVRKFFSPFNTFAKNEPRKGERAVSTAI